MLNSLLLILKVTVRLSNFSDKFEIWISLVQATLGFSGWHSILSASVIISSVECSDWFFLGQNFAIWTVSVTMLVNCDSVLIFIIVSAI